MVADIQEDDTMSVMSESSIGSDIVAAPDDRGQGQAPSRRGRRGRIISWGLY